MPLRKPEVPRHDARAEAVSAERPPVVEILRVAETGSTNADLLAFLEDQQAGVGALTTIRVNN